MKKGVIIGIIIAVIIIFAAIYVLTKTERVATPQENNSNISEKFNSQITENLKLLNLENETNQIIINNFAFNPSEITVKTGEMVIWINADSTKHTIAGISTDAILLEPNEIFGTSFDAPGTYNYHCSVHPSMKGTVIVK